jgi:hypothetical protein
MVDEGTNPTKIKVIPPGEWTEVPFRDRFPANHTLCKERQKMFDKHKGENLDGHYVEFQARAQEATVTEDLAGVHAVGATDFRLALKKGSQLVAEKSMKPQFDSESGVTDWIAQ